MSTPPRQPAAGTAYQQSIPKANPLNCGVCGTSFQLDQARFPPFCSERCKLVDLGRWMNEEVGMPHEGGPSQGEAVDLDDVEEEI